MTPAEDNECLDTMRKTFSLFRRILAFGRATPTGRQVIYERLSLAVDTLAQTCPSGPTRTAIEGALARLHPTVTVEQLDAILTNIESAWGGGSSVALEKRE